jgi:hypothetical protein
MASNASDPAERQADEVGERIARHLRGFPVSAGPLSQEIRVEAQRHLGVDLAGTELRADAEADTRATRMNARAMTEGATVSFRSGRLTSSTDAGRSLLGHELVHLAQQRAQGPAAGAGSVVVQRQPETPDGGIADAGVEPLPGGLPPEPMPVQPGDMHDWELGSAYSQAMAVGDSSRAEALDAEMERRSIGFGTALPRGPQPVVEGSGAVTPDVALSLLDNMSKGEPPFKPAEGLGGSSWFTTEGTPYTSVPTTKSINLKVEIAKASNPLVFREADLIKIFNEVTDPTRLQAEADYRAKFNIPEGTPLSKKALKAINRVLDRFIEKQMWKRVGERVAASAQKVGEVILEQGGRFSDAPGKFAVVADGSKISLKGGTAPIVEALGKQGVTAEPVVVEAAEALATKMKWAGRVRGVFRYGGKVLIVVGVTLDLIKIYRAQDKLKAVVTSAGGWAGATAAGAAFAAYWTPADAAGPWAWAVHGVGTLVAGGVGYWIGSEITRYVYELVAE